MRSCELCESPARMYCESDQASLCWDCDLKVHGANFLVARHSRTLLCHACQSPTAWSAAGAKIGLTVSICQSCSGDAACADFEGVLLSEERENPNGDVLDLHDIGDDDDEGEPEELEDGLEDDDEEEGENQVVPWSSTPPPPPAMTSSSSEEQLSDADEKGFANCATSLFSLKRSRECSSDLGFQEDICRLVNWTVTNRALTGGDTNELCIEDGNSKPLKERRPEPDLDRTAESRTRSIKQSMERIERDIASGHNISAGIVDLCKLSRDL